MVSKLINYTNKLLFKYLTIVFVSFLLTIYFFQNNDKRFLNTSYSNHTEEMRELLNDYLIVSEAEEKKPKEIKKMTKSLIEKGSFLYPVLFSEIKTDYAHKPEFLALLQELPLFKGACPKYDIDCYTKNWEKNKEKYTSSYIYKRLSDWKLKKEERKTIEKELASLGKYALPYLLFFINEKTELTYEELKPFYLKLNHIKGRAIFKSEVFDNKPALVVEHFKYYYLKHLYYYSEFTFVNVFKSYFLDTEFFEWLSSSFTFNFGSVEQKRVYDVFSLYFLRTFIIFIFVMLIAYYLSVMLLLKVKRRTHWIYRLLNKLLYGLSMFPPVILIAIFMGIIYSVKLGKKEVLIIYVLFLLLIALLLIFRSIEAILIKERESDNIKALRFFGMKESMIFNKYIYKNINIQVLRKIKLLILPMIAYLIIFEYLIGFQGVGGNLLGLLVEKKYLLLRVDILFLGLVILLSEIVIDFMIFLNLKEIRKNETSA